MPNEPEKNQMPQNKSLGTTQIHTTQLPIDLASKVIVKPANDNTKMIQQPTFRTIQQAPQMRVVRMPTPTGSGTQIIQTQIMPQTILAKAGTMQPTGRSTITVSKSPAATYLPRVTATLSTIQQTKAGQQIRTPTPPVSGTGIPPSFVRTSMTPRTSSPTAVLSQGTTAWVSGTGAMQVQVPTQLIRSTITAQNRTHILQPNTVTVTNNAGNAQIANIFGQQGQQQNLSGSTTTISVPATSSGGNQQSQPTYVATVLPQRPQATIVYTSQQQQPFLQGQVQRMGITNATANARQVRPIQRIPTTGIRVNTSSINIRQNVPGLTPTTVLTTQNRAGSNLVANSTTISNTIPARIFQVATSQSPSGTQQVSIGQQNQKILQANVMTLPIIVNQNRLAHAVKTPLQQGIITHANQTNSATSIQVSQGNVQNQQGPTFTSQSGQQVTNLSTQGGSQIITVSQQQPQQLMSQGNIHQQAFKGPTVVPLQINSRNIPIKTITVSTSNAGSLDANTIHRNLTGGSAATTIMPIAKIVSHQQQQNLASSVQSGNQSTPVFIHTRIPAPSSTAISTQPSQVVTVSTPSSNNQSGFSSNSATVYYEPASVSIAPSLVASSDQTKTTASSSIPNSESYTVVSGPNVRYSEKMIHSIIANSFQQQNANNANQSSSNVSNQAPTVRYSPLVVESQSQSVSVGVQNQSQPHQIITMSSSGAIIQQGSQVQQQQPLSVESVLSSIASSPHSAIRKNETTPVKMTKQKVSKAIAKQQQEQQKQIPVMIPSSSNSSPPKGVISLARKQSECNEEWSDDGSTTVSIPNSPSPEEDDLDAMIMSNQFNNKKIEEDLSKFQPKSAAKITSAVKRELGLSDQMTPRKKLKTASERMAAAVATLVSMEAVDKGEFIENNENIKKREVILKKPQASLLVSYNQNWKPAPNHFMRYSDVRVRDDRRTPSVMDLANQPLVLQRINGWKTYLIKAEIDEVINDETHEMEILTSVLKRLETKESGSDAEKINELIKGNVQRSRLIIDSLNDSKTQLMKIFDHKDHASEIVNRCASKRNFKKR